MFLIIIKKSNQYALPAHTAVIAQCTLQLKLNRYQSQGERDEYPGFEAAVVFTLHCISPSSKATLQRKPRLGTFTRK